MKRKTNKAFTLSEVLIALTVIGVIAAITIPALIQRTNKQEYVSALQKTYSTLSQAANMIIAEHGSPKADENGESWLSGSASVYNIYKKYLSNAKDCKTEQGCLYEGNYKYLRGVPDSYSIGANSAFRFVMADGAGVYFSNTSNACNLTKTTWHSGSNDVCSIILVDINGVKAPNQYGRDTFAFVLKENGLYPAGCDDESYCSSRYNGAGCACKVLKEGAMNY